MSSIRLYKADDYSIVTSWWNKRNLTVIPEEFLSAYGFIDANAAMWLYPQVTTKFAMIRFPITNPDATNIERSSSLDLIFDTVHKLSKSMGFNKIFCTTNHEGLSNRLVKYGYTLTDENCKHFWVGV